MCNIEVFRVSKFAKYQVISPLQNHENAMINCENALQMVQMHSKVILLGGIYAVLVSLGKYVWVSVGK